MSVLRLWLGAELRRRWRSQLLLAALVGAVGAAVLTVGAGARATSSAYDRFTSRQAVPDAEFDSLTPEARETVARLRGVRAAGAYAPLFAAPAREGVFPGQDFIVFAAADSSYGRTVDRPVVLGGRLPHEKAVDSLPGGLAMGRPDQQAEAGARMVAQDSLRDLGSQEAGGAGE